MVKLKIKDSEPVLDKNVATDVSDLVPDVVSSIKKPTPAKPKVVKRSRSYVTDAVNVEPALKKEPITSLMLAKAILDLPDVIAGVGVVKAIINRHAPKLSLSVTDGILEALHQLKNSGYEI